MERPVVTVPVVHDIDSALALRDQSPFVTLSSPTILAKNLDPCGRGAGGRTVAHQVGGAEVVGQQTRAPRACFFFTGATNGGEPRIGVTKKGWVFYAGVDASGLPWRTPTVRSRDGGRTWEDVSPTTPDGEPFYYSLDPYLYVDHDTDRVFTADLILPCTRLSFSDDGGESWTNTITGCDVMDFQKIFAGPPPKEGSQPTGYPNVVYFCAIEAGVAVASASGACEKSLDGGTTFVRSGTSPYPPGPDTEPGCTGGSWPGAVSPDGTVYVPRPSGGITCGTPVLAISSDEGMTWEKVAVAEMPARSSEVAVDAKGNIYYVFNATEDRLPYLTVSRDGGKSWSQPVMVAAPGVKETWGAFVAVGSPGRVAISYMGSTNSPGPPFEGGDCPNGGPDCREGPYKDVTWDGYMGLTVNALGPRPILYSGSVNDPGDPLMKGICGSFRCQHAYDFLGIDIGPDGTPWGAFSDGCYEGSCVHDGPVLPNVGRGVVGRLIGGPSLRTGKT